MVTINKKFLLAWCLFQGMYLSAAGELVLKTHRQSSGVSRIWSTYITRLASTPWRLLSNYFLLNRHSNKLILPVSNIQRGTIAQQSSSQFLGNSPVIEIRSVPVCRQGFDTSCGFHALKNGILVAQKNLTQADDEQIKDVLFGLPNSRARMSGGFWRQAVVAKRMQMVMFEYAKAEMRQNFFGNPTNPDAVQALLISIGDAILQKKIQKLFNFSGAKIELTINDFHDALKVFKSGEHDSQERRQAVVFLQANPSILQVYMNAEAKLVYTEQRVEAALGAYNNRVQSYGLTSVDPTGNGLNSGEIEALIGYEREHGVILQDKNLPITVIEDISLAGNPELNLYDFGAVRNALKTQPDYKHVFLLGTMRHSNAIGSGGMGHWFTLVVTPSRAFVADSVGADRCFDESVRTILALLDKTEIRKATDHPIPAQAELYKQQQRALIAEINQLIDSCSYDAAAVEKLQIDLIAKQQECEKLGVDFGQCAQKLKNRFPGLVVG